MKGLELSELFFREKGLPLLKKAVPAQLERIAAGLAGEGSDCFGFDDEISQDHDWGPGFCIWLSDSDYQAFGRQLQQAYDGLGKSFKGFTRKETAEGSGRVGVMRIEGFYARFLGIPQAPEALAQWRRIPESHLAAATNGAVFMDGPGVFSKIRDRLLAYYPEDLRIKKIIAQAAIMSQAGQYNYPRCLRHEEPVAAALALTEFVNGAISMVYLLNKRYKPFYKWAHRGIKGLPLLPEGYDLIRRICCEKSTSRNRQDNIELLCGLARTELERQGLTCGKSSFLLDHCQSMLHKIDNADLRSMHIMQEW